MLIIALAMSVSAVPVPDALYAMNSSGTYNETFWEDLSGNGNNLSTTGSTNYIYSDPYNIGYYRMRSTGVAAQNLDYNHADYQSTTKGYAIDFHASRQDISVRNMIALTTIRAYNETGSVTSCFTGTFLVLDVDEVRIGTSSNKLTFDYSPNGEYAHYVLKFEGNESKLFVNGEYKATGILEGTTCNQIGKFQFEKLTFMDSSFSGYGNDIYGPVKVYLDTITDLDAIELSSEILIPQTITNTFGFNSEGIYNETFIEDLGIFENNVSWTGTGTPTIETYFSDGTKRFSQDEITTSYFQFNPSDVSSRSSGFGFSFLGLNVEKNPEIPGSQYFPMTNRIYIYDSSGASCESNEKFVVIEPEYIRLGADGTSIRYNYSVSEFEYEKLLFYFEGNRTYLYSNGVEVAEGYLDGISCTGIKEFVFAYSNILDGRYASNTYTEVMGEVSFYKGSLNSTELQSLSTYNIDGQILNSIYPFDDNLVIQRDMDTNTADVDIVISGSKNSLINISLGDETGQKLLDSDGKGTYTFTNVPIGTYNLSLVYADGFNEWNISELGVGDIWIVTGQSNSLSTPGLNWTTAGYTLTDTPFQTSMIHYNTGVSDVPIYIKDWGLQEVVENNWASSWIPLIKKASYLENIPIMVIHGGLGATTLEWHYEGEGNTFLNNITDQYTNNERKVTGFYFYQGEADRYNTNYSAEFSRYVNYVFEQYDILSNTFLTIPIADYGTEPSPGVCSYYDVESWPTFGQYDAAKSDSRIKIGAVVNDINTTNLTGCIHFYAYDDATPLSMRIMQNGLGYVYGYDTIDRPNINSVYYVNESEIHIIYDRAIKITDFKNNAGSIAYGYEFFNDTGLWTRDAKINNSHIVSTTIDNNILKIVVSEDLSDIETMSYGIRGYDTYGLPVVRSATLQYLSSFKYDPPAPVVYDMLITNNAEYSCNAEGKFWFQNECYNEQPEISKTCNSISEQVYDSFNMGIIALIVLVAALIVGILMTAFGGQGFDATAIKGTIATVILVSIMFVIGVIVYGYVSGAIC